MSSRPQTRWLLLATPQRRGLAVELTVDTDAPAVVDAIEQAAQAHGVQLARIVATDDVRRDVEERGEG